MLALSYTFFGLAHYYVCFILLTGYFIILTILTFHDLRIGGAHASVDRDVYASRSIDDADRGCPLAKCAI